MVKHIIVWTLKDELSADEKKTVKANIKSGLEGLAGKIPGMVEIHVRTEGLPSSNGDLLLDSTFENVESLKGYSPAEKVLAMTTQVTYEGSYMETYEVGRRLRDGYDVLEARDMTLEAVVTKLMWILGDRPGSWEEISRRFYEPVALDTLVTD